MSNRLVIIGDSFAQPSYREEDFYGSMIREMVTGLQVIIDGKSSRDVQTIIDHWIKVLPELDEDDYLIVAIPFFGRTRLPIEKDHWDIVKVGKTDIINRFVGTPSYHPENVPIEFYGNNFGKEYFMELLRPQEIIISGNASDHNYLEIISSLEKITRSKKYIFTWDDKENPRRTFDSKNELSEKMGGWKTLYEEFIETDGLRGKKHDLHWSPSTHLLFSDFIIKEFGLKRKIL